MKKKSTLNNKQKLAAITVALNEFMSQEKSLDEEPLQSPITWGSAGRREAMLAVKMLRERRASRWNDFGRPVICNYNLERDF